LPGLGLVAMAGPVVAALVGALEGAIVVGGLSALGAALSQLGMPKDQIIKYETALKVDRYVLMIHGSAEDATKARSILINAQAWKEA
jgi:predicted exporter